MVYSNMAFHNGVRVARQSLNADTWLSFNGVRVF
jgi:hypothetical protein